ncbi:TonB-dependent receptor, putative [Microscilla marina ATCC 23134]|uniref:TonB-dependent receptor, putative n=1 Tax=Microscilla marina ATCC 23134 TaxID=313606 RepID=A1ZPQ9_MICM2|nr:TonB-dependent receptor, putative [Microscilla marina ATCC 23134]
MGKPGDLPKKACNQYLERRTSIIVSGENSDCSIKFILLFIFMYRQVSKFKWVWCCLLTLVAFRAQAQSDTIIGGDVLKEVRIYGIPIEKYATGSKVHRLDSALLATVNHTTLANILQQQSPVYIKSYGNEMLSTASFRGTGAGHTAVLWNGLNINTLSNGQTDFSLVPMFVIDQVSIQPGSASAMYGSDAIGGSIHLQNDPTWRKGWQAEVQQNIGSFGQYFSAAKASVGTGKFESVSQVYRYSANNDFRVRISPTENSTQQNASVYNYGFQQALSYRIASNQYVSVQGWYSFSDKQTQATRGDNFSNDLIKQTNTRIVADYVLNDKVGFLNVKLGYIDDYLLYNENSTTATRRGIATIRYEKQLNTKLSLQVGSQWTHIKTNVDAYGRDIAEDRTAIYGSLRWQVLPRWQLSANVRQAHVTSFVAPFAPSLGSELALYKTNNKSLIFKLLASRNYRVPTLNDRFWQGAGGVGNPTLRPETGWSGETGLAYSQQNKHFSWQAELTYYQMQVTDWILWKPVGSVWSPENVSQVDGTGVEGSLRLKWQQTSGYVMLGGNYAYTQSIIAKADNADFIGKQLLYTPLHSSNVYAHWQYRGWFIQTDLNHTGLRYLENSNSSFIEGFTLFNASLGKNFRLGKHWWSLSARVNNMFNEDYESVNNRAMPGRNYQLSLRYKIGS